MLIRCLRQDTSIDIECHDILLSAENAEELLVQRKTDLAITLQPVISRSVICMPLHTIRNSLYVATNILVLLIPVTMNKLSPKNSPC